jgi:hypothetical protein
MHTLLAFLVCAQLAAPGTPQIHWERSLEDAAAIARAEGRPLLLAVNMDGESASERIVRELYKDPAFVEHTRPFVCVVASVFRHTPRDRDDEGRRIECPRLGEVTCGEHMALEPLMYDRWLGGERIAPRHALILQDGTKHTDLTLLFDLAEIDRMLVEAASLAPEPAAEDVVPPTGWTELAQLRSSRGRRVLEGTLADTGDAAELARALTAIGDRGNAGSLDALALLVPRTAGIEDALVSAARELALEAELAAIVRDRIVRLDDTPRTPELGADAPLLELLARLAPDEPATRTLLLAYVAFPNGVEPDGAPHPEAPPELVHARAGCAALTGGSPPPDPPTDPTAFLARALGWRDAPAPDATDAPLPAAAELEQRLGELDAAFARDPEDPELRAAFGRATLDLARVRMEAGGSGVELLLQDAHGELVGALGARPDDVQLALDAARAAYYLSDFAEQQRLARIALERAESVQRTGDASGAVDAERLRVEALRWLGDAAGRRLAELAGGDAAPELANLAEGGAALMEVAASPHADANDWVSVASFFAALGRWREETAFVLEGLERYPDDQALHQALHRAASTAGWPATAAELAKQTALAHEGSATSWWYAGYELVALGDWLRREERPDRAIEVYGKGQGALARALELEPAFEDSVQHYIALASLGRGFAHLLADRRQEAADELVLALQRRKSILVLRDGLDREPLDLLDGALEERAAGPSPVETATLMMRLEATDYGKDFWPRAMADSWLREALRAEGRGQQDAFDECIRQSLHCARRALELDNRVENRRLLAQSATVLAESMIARVEAAHARNALRIAAPLLDEQAPITLDLYDLSDIAARLRTQLGDARPIPRPGR